MRKKQPNKEFMSPKEIEEFNEFCTSFVKTYFSFMNKIHQLRTNLIKQLGDILLEFLSQNKIKIRENQLGIAVSDEGISIQCHVNRKSSYGYEIIKIDLIGNITVNRMNDHLNLIDHLLPIVEKLFTQNYVSNAQKQKKK